MRFARRAVRVSCDVGGVSQCACYDVAVLSNHSVGLNAKAPGVRGLDRSSGDGCGTRHCFGGLDMVRCPNC